MLLFKQTWWQLSAVTNCPRCTRWSMLNGNHLLTAEVQRKSQCMFGYAGHVMSLTHCIPSASSHPAALCPGIWASACPPGSPPRTRCDPWTASLSAGGNTNTRQRTVRVGCQTTVDQYVNAEHYLACDFVGPALWVQSLHRDFNHSTGLSHSSRCPKQLRSRKLSFGRLMAAVVHW